MTFLERRLLLLGLLCEVSIFVLLYCFGPKGFKMLSDLKQQARVLQQDIVQIEYEISILKKDIQAGLGDFTKEKIAREKLLMKKDQELVYFKIK